MRFLFLAAVVLGAAGCLIPVPLGPVPTDGGSNGFGGGLGAGGGQPGGGPSGGIGGGAGSGCDLPTLSVGETFTIPASSCGTTTITAPDGSIVNGNTFTPTMPGEYVVTAATSTGTVTRYLFVDGVFDYSGSFERAYVDRVDLCVALFMTDAGTLLCERDTHQIAAYSSDGALLGQFPGARLGVLGNEVWSSLTGKVEHRTDIGSTLRLDGEYADPLIDVERTYWGAETATGKSLRGGTYGVVEVVWDGSSLSANRRVDQLQWYQYGPIFLEGSTLFCGTCTYRAGCSSMLCPAVETCPQKSSRVIAIDETNVWIHVSATQQTPSVIRKIKRPFTSIDTFESERVLSSSLAAWEKPGNANSALSPRLYTLDENGPPPNYVLVPTDHGFYAMRAGNIYTAQQRFLLEYVDPFTIRVIPR